MVTVRAQIWIKCETKWDSNIYAISQKLHRKSSTTKTEEMTQKAHTFIKFASAAASTYGKYYCEEK